MQMAKGEKMNKELAIRILRSVVLGINEQTHEAVFMAIKALKAEPVRHGKWIKQKYEDTDGSAIDGWECSVCGEGVVWRSDDDINLEKYCYHCGAKMDEVNDEVN